MIKLLSPHFPTVDVQKLLKRLNSNNKQLIQIRIAKKRLNYKTCTSRVTNMAWPMWRAPVTFGGGIGITNGSPSAALSGLKYPCPSHLPIFYFNSFMMSNSSLRNKLPFDKTSNPQTELTNCKVALHLKSRNSFRAPQAAEFHSQLQPHSFQSINELTSNLWNLRRLLKSAQCKFLPSGFVQKWPLKILF